VSTSCSRKETRSSDIVPTLLEATGIKAPEIVNGIPQKPIEGVSMVYTFDKAHSLQTSDLC
jgi:arylsulfatase A-like enzyme